MKHVFLTGLLVWYVLFFLFMAIAPVDPQSWAFANILPVLLVCVLVVTHQHLPFSCTSYALLTVFLTLHTIGSHYTYAQVPVGLWLEDLLSLPRNEFDRIVHFCFGLLFAYPLQELFGRITGVSPAIRAWMVLLTLVALGGMWEILESWVTRIAHPEMGIAYLGAQGDIWDAQKDMAATLYGVLMWMAVMYVFRKLSGSRFGVPQKQSLELPHASDHCGYRH